jgi:hypothetical protein
MPQATLLSSIHRPPRSRAFVHRGFVLLIAFFAIAGSCSPSEIHHHVVPIKAMSQGGLPPLDYREHLRRKFNSERQKAISSDSERLLQLAAELKNEVSAESNGDSTAELHNLDQIQKLAHRVKTRMNLVLVDGRPL